MVRGRKTARITTGGHYLPRALLALEEPQEEVPQEKEQTLEAPIQAPAPPRKNPSLKKILR
jgi:hypothetical protein